MIIPGKTSIINFCYLLYLYVSKSFPNISRITKLLTFFLGFYVSQIMGRWWKQVTANPSMENVCLALNGIVYSTTESKERIAEDEKKFKQKIARYCLLSWTMCFSNFSQCLKDHLNDEKVNIYNFTYNGIYFSHNFDIVILYDFILIPSTEIHRKRIANTGRIQHHIWK